MGDCKADIDKIASKEDFTRFVGRLLKDLQADPPTWENNKLENYLDGIRNLTEDMDGYYTNMGKPVPENVNWRVFAEILAAATMYE